MKRKRLSQGKDHKIFTRTAKKVHIKNAPPSPNMRGGIRL